MYKVDKFLKATIELDKRMAALAVLIHLCILFRVILDVWMVDSSIAKKVVIRVSVALQGVLWILALFGSLRYVALLSSYELLSEIGAVLLVPCTMALFLVVSFIYMLFFEAAVRTVWKALYARVRPHSVRDDNSAVEMTSMDVVDVAEEEVEDEAEKTEDVEEIISEKADSTGDIVEEVSAPANGWNARNVRQAVALAARSFKEESLYVFGTVLYTVIAPWRPSASYIGDEPAEHKCKAVHVSGDEAPDIAVEEAQVPTDSLTQEVDSEEIASKEAAARSLKEEAALLWCRFTLALASALGRTSSPASSDATNSTQPGSQSSRWLWVAWWLLAIAVLGVALAYGTWDVHVSCGYCHHQEYGVKNTKYERRFDPPYVCPLHEICHSYTVLPEDGSTSMVVVFHASEPPADVASLSVWRVPEEAAGLWGSCDGREACSQVANATLEEDTRPAWQVPCASFDVDMEVPRFVSQCALTDLTSAAIYAYTPTYVAEDGTTVRGEMRFFRTLPSEEQPLTFSVGGDLALDTNVTNSMADLVAAEVPWFVGLGGDLTYDNGLMACYYRWDSMVNLVEEHLVITTSIRSSASSFIALQIPVVLVIGNHESGGYGIPIEKAPPFLWDYFPHRISLIQSLTPSNLAAPATIYRLDLSKRGAEAYHGHVLGRSASLLALDTMQVTSMVLGEPQQMFIEESLQSMRERKWTIAMYHVPLYPSSFADPKGEELRVYWEELFLNGRVDVAFEHHEHSYKRNHLVAREELSADGILYLGGGAWGVKPFLKDRDFNYLHKRMKLRNYMIVTVTEERVLMLAKDEDGNVIDAVSMERDADGRSKLLHELCDDVVVCQVDPLVTS